MNQKFADLNRSLLFLSGCLFCACQPPILRSPALPEDTDSNTDQEGLSPIESLTPPRDHMKANPSASTQTQNETSKQDLEVLSRQLENQGWRRERREQTQGTGVRFFHSTASGKDFGLKTPTWLALADSSRVKIEPRYTGKGEKLRTTSSLTSDCLHGINAGYFGSGQSYSLIIDKGRIVSQDAQALSRPQGKAYPARGALFWKNQSHFLFGWASARSGSPTIYSSPPDPYARTRAKDGRTLSLDEWPHALGAGPLLVHKGRRVLNGAQEAFDEGIGLSSAQPRSAIGLHNSGLVLTLVAEGRRPGAPGVTLMELANFFLSIGASDALNLDGGGSSAFSIQGQLANRPADGRERGVVSALCLK